MSGKSEKKGSKVDLETSDMQAPMLEKRDGCGEFGFQRIQAAALQLSQLQNTEKSFCPPSRVHKLTEKERKPAGPKGIPWFSQSATRESSRDYKSGERMEPWEYGCLADTSMEPWPCSRERLHKWLISFQMI